jgi:hypothetical protein
MVLLGWSQRSSDLVYLPLVVDEKGPLLPSAEPLLSMAAPPSPLSSRPERTRISCHTALDKAAYAPFRKERRMKFDNATKSHRKSGGAWRRDLQFNGSLVEMFFDTAYPDFLPHSTGQGRVCGSP